MLELSDLVVSHPGFRLGPLDFAVDDEVLVVLGPSGCGKTTLLSALAGVVAPDRGSIRLDGRSLDGRPPETRRVGLVFQDGALFPHMTARENVAYAAHDPERVVDLATTLEVEHVLDRRASTLSGGETQRVALARALAADPDALLLDEPLSNLDTPIRRRLRAALRELFVSLAIPVVYVTHDQRAATALGDRIAVLRAGRVEQIGPPEGILARPATPFVARFTGGETLPAEVVGRDPSAAVLRLGDARVRAATDLPVGVSATLCVRPARVRVSAASSATGADTTGMEADERESARDTGVVAAGDDAGRAADNVLAGRVVRTINEGDDYRLVVELDALDATLTARVPVRRGERAWRGSNERVRVSIAPEDVHVLPAAAGDE